MKVILRYMPPVLTALILAGFCALSCGDKDSGTEPSATTDYIDVYVVDSINGKPFDIVGGSNVKYFPSMLNIRLDEESNTFSGYVQITSVGWLHISEIHSYSRQFSVSAPDSLGAIEYFGFSNLNYNPPTLSGNYHTGGSTLDSRGFTFEATLTSVPAENVMNDEYYFAAGPGKTKVFVVESIGGSPLDDLPAEWGDIFPTLFDVKHYDGTEAYFRGRVYFSTLGWLDIPVATTDDTKFNVDYSDSLMTIGWLFSELSYNPPYLSGIYAIYGKGFPNITQPFVSRRTIMPVEDLPGNE